MHQLVPLSRTSICGIASAASLITSLSIRVSLSILPSVYFTPDELVLRRFHTTKCVFLHANINVAQFAHLTNMLFSSIAFALFILKYLAKRRITLQSIFAVLATRSDSTCHQKRANSQYSKREVTPLGG
jgi:hypothetical protein